MTYLQNLSFISTVAQMKLQNKKYIYAQIIKSYGAANDMSEQKKKKIATSITPIK